MSKVPKIRFKHDDGSDYEEWKNNKLEEIGTFMKGASLSKADISDTGTPLILYGELYTTYNEVAYDIKRKTQATVDNKYFSKIGDVLIPTSGESPEEISTATCVMKDGVILAGDLNIYRSKVDGRVMSYIINHKAKDKIARIAQGKSIVHIQAKTVGKVDINYPSDVEEQEKIADFLSKIDRMIEISKREETSLLELKKGLVQKIFSQEIRFKREDGSNYDAWSEKKLDEVLKEYNDKCEKDGEYEHVSLTKEGVVPKTERYERDFLVTSDDKKYRITHLNDICYNPANLKFGVICRNKYKDSIFSPIYVTFKIIDGSLPEFVELMVTRQSFIGAALKYQQGTVYERMAVSPEDLLSLDVKIPGIEEQMKIVNFFDSIDECINKTKREIEKYEELKQGLLQQMFV